MADYTGCAVRPYADEAGRCDRCGEALAGRRTRWCSQACADADLAEHYWSLARHRAAQRDGWKCVTCGSNESIEVNHIEPRVGHGYGTGCWNHLANLETLCHDCHVDVTNGQMAARRAS